MLKARLTELNENEVLLYLGYRGQEMSSDLEEQIRRCCKEIEKTAEPKLVMNVLPVKDGRIEGLPLPGKDLSELLRTSSEAVIFAAALGPEIDRLIMRREVTDMAEAVILDACAGAAIENVCNCLEEDLQNLPELRGRYLTDRFSPGYGDLPLNSQEMICEFLNTAVRIGLTLTKTDIMIPRKSVTAIIGISDLPQKLRESGCESCESFRDCRFRREGKTCHD